MDKGFPVSTSAVDTGNLVLQKIQAVFHKGVRLLLLLLKKDYFILSLKEKCLLCKKIRRRAARKEKTRKCSQIRGRAMLLTHKSISTLESGRRAAAPEKLILPAKYFDVSADYLPGLKDEP